MKPTLTRIAAYGLVEKDERLLLCRLSEQVPQWQGYWTLPGGGVEFGEHPDDAMVREVKEETGVVVSVNHVAGVDSRLTHSDVDDFHAIRIIYRANYLSGDLVFEQNGTTDQCKWFTPSELLSVNLVDLSNVGIKLWQQNTD